MKLKSPSRSRVSALALCAALGLGAGLSACAGVAPQGDAMIPPAVAPAPGPEAVDTHTYARPEIARVVDVALDLTADFEAKTLSGTATLDILAAPGANEIILDIRNLDIQDVQDVSGQPLRFVTGADDAIKGQPLTVYFPAFAPGERRKITVRYSTRPDAAALQWLSPAQTAGGEKPYLDDLTVVMSADHLTPKGEPAAAGMKSWRFRMNNPIPPYLMAVGIGDIAFAPFDERTGVWTEPSRLQAAAWELEPTAAMVDAAEKLYGPYRWGRYDLLVLPPSFPFGGMENPKLTFATPTIIAGDRSLVSLVAHELAHSWSGNLVTNATWNDFWLNEGFTSYFENRIMEAIYGRDRAVQEQVLAWDGLQDELKSLPANDTRLHLNLLGRDPDDGMSTIAYDKGAAFLRTIEETAGREPFDAWLRGYFDRNAYRPMTTAMFLEDIRAHLIKGDAALEQALQMDAWVYQPGLPSNAKAPVSNAFAPVDAAAVAFFQNKGPASAIPWWEWNTQQRQRFLGWRPEGLRSGADWLSPQQLADLERTLNLAHEGNTELTFAWLQIALAHRYQPAVATAETFLTGQGRRKFVLPLFQTLWNEGDWGRPIARDIYAKARPLYHPVTSGSVDQLVGRP
ncbi:hypothetical protein LTR94_024686 [Friedmanniomyces endolithicus]|nr:hypothetical protein LTR94_024686 [Friedmanniomyces endolithicus]